MSDSRGLFGCPGTQPWFPAATNAAYRDTPAVIIWHFRLGC